MPLPPRGNPRRPMYLAVRSMLVIGAICLAFSASALLPGMLMSRGSGGGALLPLVLGAMFFPGIGLLICEKYLAQRKFWAVVLGLVLASALLLVVLAVLAGLTVMVVSTAVDASFLIAGGISLLFLLAIVQLIY